MVGLNSSWLMDVNGIDEDLVRDTEKADEQPRIESNTRREMRLLLELFIVLREEGCELMVFRMDEKRKCSYGAGNLISHDSSFIIISCKPQATRLKNLTHQIFICFRKIQKMGRNFHAVIPNLTMAAVPFRLKYGQFLDHY